MKDRDPKVTFEGDTARQSEWLRRWQVKTGLGVLFMLALWGITS